ncbi:MAG: kelch repeat-containing protein [Silvanigrellaceae bacterium]
MRRTPTPKPCYSVDDTSGVTATGRNGAEVSIAWEAGTFSANPELWLLSEDETPVVGTQLCSSTANSALFNAATNEILRGHLVVSDPVLNKTLRADDLVLRPGESLNLGRVLSQDGFAITGLLEGNPGSGAFGKVVELNKTFPVQVDGSWSTGPLPAGRWSVLLGNTAGQTLGWRKVQVQNETVDTGKGQFTSQQNFLMPLWSGVLTKPHAPFLLSAEERFVEVRISDNASFINSFWMPLRSVFSWPVSTNGLQTVFIQMRSAENLLSEVLVQQFRVELANVLETADAIVMDPLVSQIDVIDANLKLPDGSSLKKKVLETGVRTIPPAGAIQHSVTVDVDELPRQWFNVDSTLTASLPLTAQSCGRHSLFVRFRDGVGRETQSLRREWNIRCWDKNIPAPPLAARWDHGAASFKFCLNPVTDTAVNCSDAAAVESDGIFIWGGRNETQIFADGAMLRKFNNGWRWDLLPANPALSARTNPKIIAGLNNIMVINGESADGQAATGAGIFRLSTSAWLNTLPTNAPTPLLHSTAAYIRHATPDDQFNLAGAFLVIGGETKNATTNLPEPSSNLAYLYEGKSGLLQANWQTGNMGTHAFSRSGFGVDASGKALWLVSGLTGASPASGTDPEVTSEIIAFMSASERTDPADPATAVLDLYTFLYTSANSRVGSLNGHILVNQRFTKVTDFESAIDYLETTNPCVFGGQKYTDVLPDVCKVIEVVSGQPKAYGDFCRRMYDSYNFAPVGKRGVCFHPSSFESTDANDEIDVTKYMKNFFLPMQGAPAERRLLPNSGASFPGIVPRLFIWSGVSALGGEYLSDGAIYELLSNRWTPVTTFEAPAPRQKHTATALPDSDRVFIFGGRTAAGASAQGVFYALP